MNPPPAAAALRPHPRSELGFHVHTSPIWRQRVELEHPLERVTERSMLRRSREPLVRRYRAAPAGWFPRRRPEDRQRCDGPYSLLVLMVAADPGFAVRVRGRGTLQCRLRRSRARGRLSFQCSHRTCERSRSQSVFAGRITTGDFRRPWSRGRTLQSSAECIGPACHYIRLHRRGRCRLTYRHLRRRAGGASNRCFK